jgi:hypothetical protein
MFIHYFHGGIMKKTLIAAALLATAFTAPAWAADGNQPGGPPPQGDFKERKTQLLKRMDERIAGMQEERKCVQAAKSEDDLRSCRDKQRAMRGSHRDEMRTKHQQMRSSPTQTAGK